MKKHRRLLPVLLAAAMMAGQVTPVTALASEAVYEDTSPEQFGGGRG